VLHALAIADGLATGPAAWNDWKATLVADLVRRVEAVLDGQPMPRPAPLREDQLTLAAEGGPAATVLGSEVTVVAPDRPGLLWRAAGVLASHRLAVRSANATSVGATAVSVFDVEPEFGDPPDATLVAADLRRMLQGRLDVEDRLDRRARAVRPRAAAVPAPKVSLVDDAPTPPPWWRCAPTTRPACSGGSAGRWGVRPGRARGPGGDARRRGGRRVLRDRRRRQAAGRR
jgi:UTP:GlnB (protein PII) uridylyltransferase